MPKNRDTYCTQQQASLLSPLRLWVGLLARGQLGSGSTFTTVGEPGNNVDPMQLNTVSTLIFVRALVSKKIAPIEAAYSFACSVDTWRISGFSCTRSSLVPISTTKPLLSAFRYCSKYCGIKLKEFKSVKS